ncbi:MAG TPA: hypothetical protein VFA22_12260 [Stellaceae bacterium]|nr:hypothetical protein [Stellaceae bacterium]
MDRIRRLLLFAFLLTGVVACGIAAAPYDGDCTSGLCNGHMMGNQGGGGGGM